MLLEMARFHTFLWLNNIPQCMCVGVRERKKDIYSFFIWSSIDRHLGCFHNLAVVNYGAMNMRVQIIFSRQRFCFLCFLWVYVSFWSVSFGIAGSYKSSTFNFLRSLILFSIVVVSVYSPTNSVQEFPCQHLQFLSFWYQIS